MSFDVARFRQDFPILGSMVRGNCPSHFSACVRETRPGLSFNASPRALIASASASPRSLIASDSACAANRTASAEACASARRASARRNAVSSEEPEAYFAPQHRSVPVFTSLLSTPGRGLAEISVTPVSV